MGPDAPGSALAVWPATTVSSQVLPIGGLSSSSHPNAPEASLLELLLHWPCAEWNRMVDSDRADPETLHVALRDGKAEDDGPPRAEPSGRWPKR